MIAARAGALRRRLLTTLLVLVLALQPTAGHVTLRGRRLLQAPAVTFEPPPPPVTYSPTTSPTAAPVFPVTAELEVMDSEVDGLDAALLTPLRTFLAQYTGLAYDEVLTHSHTQPPFPACRRKSTWDALPAAVWLTAAATTGAEIQWYTRMKGREGCIACQQPRHRPHRGDKSETVYRS